MVDLERRSRRRREAARKGRRRLAASLVLALLLHLLGVPLVGEVFRFEASEAPEEAAVEVVRIPGAQWDRAMADGRRAAERSRPREPGEKKEVERKEKPLPERAPGQVVDVAPGNREEDPDARFAAETSNKAERETIARDRRAGEAITMPKPTVSEAPKEPAEDGPREEALALGPPGEEKAEGAPRKQIVEIPSVERQDALDLPEDPSEPGRLRSRESAPGVDGNSDRLRVELGESEGEEGEEGRAAGGGGLRLFPSGEVVDRIVGGPAPDHVEGVDEGVGTFLSTKEWKHASFFNRVKKSVALTWNPLGVLRARDPTGNVYAWKDRMTQVAVALREDGSIADVWVEKSSGVDFLDREAVAAFERAQPFPNPPRAMIDETGLIRFSFGFHIQTGQPFRIFRRY